MLERHRRAAVTIGGAAIVFLIAFVPYVATLRSGVGIGDEAEAQTVPYILGIAHPTGFPAYTLAGWLFSHLLAFGTVAWRLNVFTAIVAGLSAAGVFLIGTALGADALAAVFAALVFAFGASTWHDALYANAQSLAALCGIVVLYLSVLAARASDGRLFIAACAVCGFGMAAHPSAVWSVGSILAAGLWQLRSLSLPTIARSVAALLAPLVLYAYLPLRSAYVAWRQLDPTAPLNLGRVGHVDLDMNTTRTLPGFLDEVLGRNESAGYAFAHAFNPAHTLDAWHLWIIVAIVQYGVLTLIVALVGVAVLVRVDLRALSVLLAGTAGSIAFIYIYRTNANLDRYAILPFAVTAALAATAERLTLPRVPRGLTSALVVGALAFATVYGINDHRPPAELPPDSDGEAIIAAARRDIPDGAIIVVQWNEATALGYGSYVEHSLGSRIIVSAWPWEYDRQLLVWGRRRPVFLYIDPYLRSGPVPTHVHLIRLRSSLPGYLVLAVVPLPSGRAPARR